MAHVKYFWDEIEDNVIREYDENNNTIAHYTTEPELYGRVVSQDRGGEVRHYKYDGQGNTVALTDNSGNVTDTRKYSAFGEVTESTGTTEFPYQYNGRFGYHTESASGDIAVRRRFYSSAFGRWLSTDPLGFEGGGNLFQYVDSNPLNVDDPSGQVPIDCQCRCSSGHYGTDYKALVDCDEPDNICCANACRNPRLRPLFLKNSQNCYWVEPSKPNPVIPAITRFIGACTYWIPFQSVPLGPVSTIWQFTNCEDFLAKFGVMRDECQLEFDKDPLGSMIWATKACPKPISPIVNIQSAHHFILCCTMKKAERDPNIDLESFKNGFVTCLRAFLSVMKPVLPKIPVID